MDWEDIKDLLGELALYVWFFGMGIASFYVGFSSLGNTYISKHKYRGTYGEPYVYDWVNGIPMWFAGTVLIGLGFYFLYNHRIKK